MSVIFTQLRLSDDGQRMYINAHVNNASYFDGIFLDSLTIMTSDKVSETNPNIPTSDYIYRQVFDGQQKQLDLVLTVDDFMRSWEADPNSARFKRSDMGKTLFFVYVKIKGTPDVCTPCRLDEEITLGVTFDEKLLYQRVMDYINELLKDCTVPVGFADFILLWNAFKAAIETEHYVPAIKFWNMLFDINTGAQGFGRVTAKGCGCHG